MKWHKRVELWALLVLVVSGLAWIFTHPGSGEIPDPPETGNSEDHGAAPLKVLRCTLTRDHDSARLDIDVRVHNDSAERLVLQSPAVKLLTAGGREVPSFFLPFDPQPEVSAHSTQDGQLRYWLEAADLATALTLKWDGHTAEVKSSQPYDLKGMKGSGQADFAPGQW